MNGSARKAYLKHCSHDFIDCICECTKNLLHGNVPVTAAQYRKLKPYKQVLRRLSDNKLSNKKRRQLLVKQKGGFLGFLLGPVASALGPLVSAASSVIGSLINRNRQ
jgi:hypothetical protein